MAAFGKVIVINQLDLLDGETECPVYPGIWVPEGTTSRICGFSLDVNVDIGPVRRGESVVYDLLPVIDMLWPKMECLQTNIAIGVYVYAKADNGVQILSSCFSEPNLTVDPYKNAEAMRGFSAIGNSCNIHIKDLGIQ